MSAETYVVAGHKRWNRDHFQEYLSQTPGQWHFVGSKEELTEEFLQDLSPRYVFFLHWSHIVPTTIVLQYECVCFHMTDVPYGRGGSPLQNLILRGHTKTKLTALRMTATLDEGPVYIKQDLPLTGTAEEIYVRASRLSCDMILDLIGKEAEPIPQEGEIVPFQRRIPEDSLLPGDLDLDAVHDFIRMLDAEGYPNAFVDVGSYRITFRRAARYHQCVRADVSIELRKENGALP